MNVRQLIEMLQEFPEDSLVCVHNHEGDQTYVTEIEVQNRLKRDFNDKLVEFKVLVLLGQ